MMAILAALAANPDVLARVQGRWELDPAGSDERGTYTCEAEPLTIITDAARARFASSRGEAATAADILEVRDDAFLIRYDGEDRLDEAGRPVEWFLLLLDGDTRFAWVRRDWIDPSTGDIQGATALRRRCPEPMS